MVEPCSRVRWFVGTVVVAIGSVAVLVLAVFAIRHAWTSARPTTYGINGWTLRVSLVPDKAEIMVGEPLGLSYRVENLSDTNLEVLVGGDRQNRFGRPSRFTVVVASAVDELPSLVDEMAGPGGGIVAPVKIPARGRWDERLYLPDWVVIQTPGIYTVRASRTLNLFACGGNPGANVQPIDLPTQAEARFTVVPADARRMGALIDRLAQETMGPKGEYSENAMKLLSCINDERAIPPLLAAMKSCDYELKLNALWALEKFDTDAAVAGFEKALGTTWRDFEGATGTPIYESLAENIRTAAAQALLQSRRPRAREALLAHNLCLALSFRERESLRAETLRVSQLKNFMLFFNAKNTGAGEIDFQLRNTILYLNGLPAPDWEFIASNGFGAAPMKLTREQSYVACIAFGNLYFKTPGTYTFVWKFAGAASEPCTVTVTK